MNDQLTVILERLDTLQKAIDRIDRDLSADRQDLQQLRARPVISWPAQASEQEGISRFFRKYGQLIGGRALSIRSGAVEAQIDEMRKAISTLATKVHDRMQDVVDPLMEEIEKKKVSPR